MAALFRATHGKLGLVQPVLGPPATKGHVSVARLTRYWYVACQSHELGSRPVARVLLGTPFVLFRDAGGKAAALLDRCPHRNVPLSLGRVNGRGHLECPYHGWQFDTEGKCRAIPGLGDAAAARERSCPRAAVCEQDGLVWVFPALDEAPASEPPDLGFAKLTDHTWVRQEVRAQATLHATLENALDVPHTAFLHRGLFRGGERHAVTVRVRRSTDRVEAEYVGEPRPSGVVGRLLSPTGGVVEHWDRFLLPSIAQVEYRLGPESHFLITAFCTPESDFSTRLIAVAGFKTPLPGRILAPLLKPVALLIFNQDARILRAQSKNVQSFGGERFESTELDFLGPHIWRLLKQAERGELGEASAEREVTFFA
ncbi:MAG TPA: aromatic ring-hydroxylating dioxygenase subunit alpha [Polyangiaceae bacterium]|nr:aromatic ring-hydroxylating dioxygenase subunit alpha [Polyangiaceae bacterium]